MPALAAKYCIRVPWDAARLAAPDSGNFPSSQPQIHWYNASDDQASTIVAMTMHTTCLLRGSSATRLRRSCTPYCPPTPVQCHWNLSGTGSMSKYFYVRPCDGLLRLTLALPIAVGIRVHNAADRNRCPPATYHSDHNGTLAGCCDTETQIPVLVRCWKGYLCHCRSNRMVFRAGYSTGGTACDSL